MPKHCFSIEKMAFYKTLPFQEKTCILLDYWKLSMVNCSGALLVDQSKSIFCIFSTFQFYNSTVHYDLGLQAG